MLCSIFLTLKSRHLFQLYFHSDLSSYYLVMRSEVGFEKFFSLIFTVHLFMNEAQTEETA